MVVDRVVSGRQQLVATVHVADGVYPQAFRNFRLAD
jgi:hypothetical protein